MAYTDPRTWVTDELVTAAIMNTHVRDNFRATTSTVVKTADETVTSSVALQDDDHLTFAIAANELWYVKFVMWFSNAADAGHFKIAFNGPAGVTYHLAATGKDASSVFGRTELRAVANTTAFFSTATGVTAEAEGIVVNGGTAGNFTLQWAQNTSNGTGTVLKKGSVLIRSKLA